MIRQTAVAVAALVAVVFVVAREGEAAQRSRQSGPRMAASAFVPGTGTFIPYASDDFEWQDWSFVHQHPKSSREQDERVRGPMGRSTNDRWHEGPERGQPDQIEVVPTPAGGLEGSSQALLMRTLHSGIPGYNSADVQQDDLISNMLNRIGSIPVSERPSIVVRVFLPPPSQWEQRQGPHFGFRTSASTVTEKSGGLFSLSEKEAEPYWPGMWIHFRPAINNAKNPKMNRPASAYIAIRGDKFGRDFHAKEINEFGWWTLGMSYTGDGMVHYYASPGVDDLTAADFMASEWPYSYQARQFRTYFFDVCNNNNGRTWSTPFIIDDPRLYVGSPQRIQSIVNRREKAAEQMAERRAKQAAEMERRRELAKQRQAERAAAREQQGNSRSMNKR